MKTVGNHPISPTRSMKRVGDVAIVETTLEGLTKRELFAAMAMQGLSSNVDMNDVKTFINIKDLPQCAVAMADVLILELNKDS